MLKKFESYLSDILGIHVVVQKWTLEQRLPIFLRDLYDFFECRLLDTPHLLMAAKDHEQTPGIIRKHMQQVADKWGKEIIYLHPSISSYNRKRLIEQKISFVVPGKQMYLPLMGIDLREHIRKLRSPMITFTPSTQAVMLYAIYNRKLGGFTPLDLANTLDYTQMTLTRVFDEIESSGLGDVKMVGRQRVLKFDLEAKDLWEKAYEYFRSAVKKRVVVQLPDHQRVGLFSGLSALSRYTMLSEPDNPAYAVSTDQWKYLKQSGIVLEQAFKEPGAAEVEIWSYAPDLFGTTDTVDRLSLYLTLKDSKDERIESALTDLLETFEW